MKKAKSNTKKLVNGLNVMAEEELDYKKAKSNTGKLLVSIKKGYHFVNAETREPVEGGELNYKKAILAEDKRIGLKARQSVVNADLERIYGVDLNTKEGGSKEMKVKGGVKQKQTTKKVVKVVPPKVNLLQIGEKAEGFLKGLETGLDGVKYEMEKVYIGEINFRQNSRLIFGIRYRVCGSEVTFSLVTKETFKNFSKELQGKYAPGNWNVLFDFVNGNDIKKFSPIIKASLEKLKKAKEELPKDKVKK